jgi:hypothetical protein
MRFLRTASTGRLLAVLAAAVIVIGGGSAIAVAATTSDPVPPASALATALHGALSAPKVSGITANVTFTNNLIDSSDFTGQSADPLLQGATGRLWLTDDGRLRIELQSDDGDAQIVVDHRSFWISDPAQQTVYEGTLPAGHDGSSGSGAIPSIAQIQTELTKLMSSADISGAQPTDVAGRAAYRVSISPRTSGGLVGSAQLAWDAATGVPLDLAVYARGDTSPVLELKATSIGYGSVPDSDVDVSPPAGSRVVQLGGSGGGTGATTSAGSGDHPAVRGLAAVSAAVPFTLQAPATLAGRARAGVSLIGHDTALITYGDGLDGLAVIESPADASSSGSSTTSTTSTTSTNSGSGSGGLSLPTPTVNGVTATELSTPLGTVVHLSQGGVAETVIGSVTGPVALQAAGGL